MIMNSRFQLRNPMFSLQMTTVIKINIIWRGKHRRQCCRHLDRFVNWFNL